MKPDEIAGLRRRLVKKWFQSTENDLRSVYSGTREYRRKFLLEGAQFVAPAEDEIRALELLQRNIVSGNDNGTSFLALSLYLFPHQLPSRWYQLFSPPEWLWDDYFTYLNSYPVLFRESGEPEFYLRFMETYLEDLLVSAKDNPRDRFQQQALDSFVNRYIAHPLYFNSVSVQKVFTLRAQLIALYLRNRGHPLDHKFGTAGRERLRTGFLKESFLPHEEALVTLPAFEHLDRERFQTFLYVLRDGEHEFTRRCYRCADQVRVIPVDLNAAAEVIRADDLDVMILGSNITMIAKPVTFLASHRLARVQATLYTSPVTTGMETIDYYLSGEFSDPRPEGHYVEKLYSFKGTGFCFAAVEEEAVLPSGALPENLSSPDRVVFASAANYLKLSSELIDNWMRILAAVPGSVLRLYPFSGWIQSYPMLPLRQELVRYARKHGVAANRLRIMPIFKNQTSLRLSLKQTDIYLDSYPYTSSCSLTDPLSQEVPVVVMRGSTLRNAMASAMVQDLGIPELICDSWRAYRDTAVMLAHDQKLRGEFRQKIAHAMQNARFMDSHDYSRQMAVFLEWATTASTS